MKQIYLILTFSFIELTAFGQTSQGYLDYEKVIQTLPEYSTGQEQLEAKTALFEDSLKTILDQHQTFSYNYLSQNDILDSSELILYEDTIRTIEKRLEDYQRYAQGEIAKAEKTIETTLKKLVSNELEQYCTIRGITCVVDKDAILHCSDCSDFTDDFVDYLKRIK